MTKKCKLEKQGSREYAQRLLQDYHIISIPPKPPAKLWVPKNKEVRFPAMIKEVALSPSQWDDTNFPKFDIPEKVETHVNIDEWESQTSKHPPGPGRDILATVLDNLKNGMDSEVKYPGNTPTFTKNFFRNPILDIPRIGDSLATEVKNGHMAGPFPSGSIPDAKINSLMSIEKADGGRRQVGNLSAPVGKSFNDGISVDTLAKWKVNQTTSRQFAEMLARAGPAAVMACCDMVAAYKTIPVALHQRKLQCFRFLGRDFVDLRMVFGDKAACMNFDRLHFCILEYFVFPLCPIPRGWVGRTIDDVPAVAPANASKILQSFTRTYKNQLNRLGIQFALEDIERRKAFDCATSGEVLGIWFDSTNMTWCLPEKKRIALQRDISIMIQPDEKISLNQIEIVHGKLNHIAQLAPPIRLLIGETIQLMKGILTDAGEADKDLRFRKNFSVPHDMRHDLKTCLAIIKDTAGFPLPILDVCDPVELGAVELYTDYSGHLLANPSLGIFSPSQFGNKPLVCSLAYPRHFLLSEDQLGHKAFSKSTSLEALGFLVPLMMDPGRFLGKHTVVVTDNAAAVLVFKKGYSKGDAWATTICRAARVVAAGLCCQLQVKWERRRSSRETRISDNLTHNLLEELDDKEIDAYIEKGFVKFPPPILNWMASPGSDLSLGRKCLDWLEDSFPFIKME